MLDISSAQAVITHALSAKPCSNKAPTAHERGAVKPFSEFEVEPRKSLGVSSHCRDCKKAARKARYENEASARAASREVLRSRAIAIYGGQCAECGITAGLEFDHVDGNGGEHRKVESAQAMVRRIAEGGRQLADVRLQLLCGGCHRPKGAGVSMARLKLLMTGNDWPVLFPH